MSSARPAGPKPKTNRRRAKLIDLEESGQLTSEQATELEQLIELSEIQEYIIKPLLRAVPGIAEINESGGYEKQFVIQPQPEALADVNMTFSELADLVAYLRTTNHVPMPAAVDSATTR